MYEEAIQTVMTVRDFTQVFDSYAQFEESMIAAKMETTSEMGREEEGESNMAGGKHASALEEGEEQALARRELRGRHAPSGLPALFVRGSWDCLGVFLNTVFRVHFASGVRR